MNPMKKSDRRDAALPILRSAPVHPAAATPSPVVRHILEAVIRRAVRGDHAAIDTLAHDFRNEMVAYAEAHMARFDVDAEDVVQNVFAALLERQLAAPPRARSAVAWLLDTVALFAQPDQAA